MPNVILPPNVTYQRYRSGDVVNLDEETIASLTRQHHLNFQYVDGTPIQGEIPQIIPTAPPPDIGAIVRVKLPENVRWQRYRGGDIVEMHYAEVAALEANLHTHLELLPMLEPSAVRAVLLSQEESEHSIEVQVELDASQSSSPRDSVPRRRQPVPQQ